jgi:hypothetical protein
LFFFLITFLLAARPGLFSPEDLAQQVLQANPSTKNDAPRYEHQPSSPQVQQTGLVCSEKEAFEHCTLTNVCMDQSGIIWLLSAAATDANDKDYMDRLQTNLKKVLQNDDVPRSSADQLRFRPASNTLSKELSSFLPSFPAASVVVAHGASGNCGHVLGDEAWPIFRLVTKIQQRRGQHFHLDHFHKYGPRSPRCDTLLTPMSAKVVNHGGGDGGGETSPSDEFEGACYDELYIGHDGFSYIDDRQKQPFFFERDMKLFRSMYHRTASSSFDENTATAADTILVMVKRFGTHMSNLENVESLAQGIQAQLPQYLVKLTSWSDYQWEQQMEVLGRTRAIVSLPGSDVMNAVFLPDNSAVLMFCRVMSPISVEASNEEGLWLRRLSYVNTTVIPCDNSEVAYDMEKGTTRVSVAFVVAQLKDMGL